MRRGADRRRWTSADPVAGIHPAGTFTIEVSSAPGYARARGEVITAAGAEAELRLRLVPR